MNILRQQRRNGGNRGGGSRQGGAGGGALTRSGVLVRGACNEAPTVASVIVVEVAEATEVTEAFRFIARGCLILSCTRSSSAEEGEAVGRQEVVEREVADCVTATLALPVVWWSLTFALLKGATPPTEGVESVLENEVRPGLYRNRQTRNRGVKTS